MIIVHCSTRGLARAERSSGACTGRAIDQVPLSQYLEICTCVVGKCVIRFASSHSGRYRTKTVLTSKAFAPSHEPHLTRPSCRSIGICPVSFVELSIATPQNTLARQVLLGDNLRQPLARTTPDIHQYATDVTLSKRSHGTSLFQLYCCRVVYCALTLRCRTWRGHRQCKVMPICATLHSLRSW